MTKCACGKVIPDYSEQCEDCALEKLNCAIASGGIDMVEKKSCNNCRYEPSGHIFPVCEKCDPETYSNWKPAAVFCPHCNGNGKIYPNGDRYVSQDG